MKSMFFAILAAAGVALTTPAMADQYSAYAQAVQAQAQAQADAESARLQAIADIAASGDNSAKIAAIMAIQSGAKPAAAGAGIAPPEDKALAWARILVPTLVPAVTHGYTARLNAVTQRHSIDAQTAQQGMMFGTLGGIATTGIEAAAKPPLVVYPSEGLRVYDAGQ